MGPAARACYAAHMAWVRGFSSVALAGVLGCTPRGGEDAGLQGGSEAGATAGAAGAESSESGGAGGTGGTDEPTAGTSPGTTPATTGNGPVQCEDGDDGWGGGNETGGDGDDGSGGGTFGMDDDMPLATNVFDVQMGAVTPGELVSLSGVATTPSSPSETGGGFELFVQALEGGPFSGLRVRVPGFDPGALVSPGDAVAVVGRLRVQDGFYLVEVDGASAGLTPGDPVAPPEPELVPADILDPENPDARPYEGVPVRIEQLVVVEADFCGSELRVGPTLRVDDRFAPDALPQLAEGATIVAIEGVLVWALDAYELSPTDPEDIE